MTLSRDLDGRAKLSNLAQGYLDDPSKEFPAGKLVRARVLSLAGGRSVKFMTNSMRVQESTAFFGAPCVAKGTIVVV